MRTGVTLLLDRDGTLIHDVPYCSDPDAVVPIDGVAESLDLLRARGVQLAVVSNQSAIGRGLATADQVAAVQAKVRALLGPFDIELICPHREEDHCECRKPKPGMIQAALDALKADMEQAVLIGDIATDLLAARSAGIHGVLVPTASTQADEVAAAECMRNDFAAAAAHVLAFVDGAEWEEAS